MIQTHANNPSKPTREKQFKPEESPMMTSNSRKFDLREVVFRVNIMRPENNILCFSVVEEGDNIEKDNPGKCKSEKLSLKAPNDEV